ncbi:cytosolic iron-sulfur protein assembly protein 1, putative [Plasmodium relictum]|uniref:Probable cytosolic iron-sulfur protein assembly protein CIAO1 homolog n=1 Tax=Plasmodium relictum TaxID=85471 RepID=A0A1J1HAN8_PLARL|nr:cytosolic iron-sulfur protein assembly protein 1, putative [Plasmodium relictum]CRH00671.1 cytosolic iron-sulfur protein assembly protein 1, putative [Plasmodium relictum]
MVIELVVNLENHKRRIWSICWSPDGNFLGSVGSDKYIIIWQKKKNTRIRNIDSGNKIMNASNTYRGKQYLKTQMEFGIYDIIETNHEKSLRHIEFSKDGNFFVVASFDSRCSIYKKNKNNKWVFYKTLEGHEKEVKCASIHPSNKYIVTCGRDKSIWIHAKVDNFEKENLCSNTYNLKNFCTSSNPNSNTNSNNYALLDDNNFDFNFDAYLTAHTEDIKFVSWCPLSENTFISLSYDNSIKIWNRKLDEWNCIQTLSEHSSVVWCVTFNFDGSEFATCSDDKTIKIWKSEKKKLYNKKKYPFLYQQIVKDVKDMANASNKNDFSRMNNYSESRNKYVKEQKTAKKNTNENNKKKEYAKEKNTNERKIIKKTNNTDTKLKEKETKKENDYDSCNYVIVNYLEKGFNLRNILKIFIQNKFIPLYFHYGLFKFLYKYSKIEKNIKSDPTYEKMPKKELNVENDILKNELVDKNNTNNIDNKNIEKRTNKNSEDMIDKGNISKTIKQNNIEKMNINNASKTNSNNNETINKKNKENIVTRNIKNINEQGEKFKDIIFDDWELKHVIEGYHKRSVSYIDWNPYENLIAVSSFDNSLKIFEKRKEKWELIENVENAHLSDVNCVVWCPQKFQDYFLLATAGDDCVINIWKFKKR